MTMKLNNIAQNVNHIALSFDQLEHISNQGASAFYFLDLEKLSSNYREFHKAFVDEYENCQIAYSFKTNYAPLIGKTLKKLGCWAEVVSAMEYEIATKKVGYSPKQVIINGPLHEAAFIEQALLEGALLNVDAWYALDIVGNICEKHPNKKFNIGIRLSYPIAEGGFSRFGIESSPDNLQRLDNWQQTIHNCTIIGFHSHFSNSSRSLISFEARIAGLLNASQHFFTNSVPHFINIGGGFFGDMPNQLASQYVQEHNQIPDFKAYARQICKPVLKQFPPIQNTTLFLEPGTALIANAMVFVCKIYDVKIVEGKTIALVNGSNHNINHKWQGESLPIQIVRKTPINEYSSDISHFDLVGNTCIEKDILRTDIQGPIEIGDYIIFQYMGGYTNVLKQPFINPCQPIYTWKNQQLITVKRQETIEDVLATYSI